MSENEGSRSGNQGRVEGLNGEKWSSWLIPGGKEDSDFQKAPPILQTRVRAIAKAVDSIADPDYLSKHYKEIEEMFLDGKITDQEAAVWLGRLGDRHKKLIEKEVSTEVHTSEKEDTAQLIGKAVGEGVAKILYGDRLKDDEQYMELLDDEQWQNTPLQPIDARSAPSYYVDMTLDERQRHQHRIELANAAFKKRNGLTAPTLEALSKEVPWNSLSKSETRRLYEETPGVKAAVKIYVTLLFAKNQDLILRKDGTAFSLLTAKDRQELQSIRRFIRDEISQDVTRDLAQELGSLTNADREKWKERGLLALVAGSKDENVAEVLKFKCRDAEQIAFNLLFLGNTFESLDSLWENGQRVRAPQTNSELVSVPIKNAMKPLDSLIASLGKDPGQVSTVGRFGEWAYLQTYKSNHKRPLDLKALDRVVVVPETRTEATRFWTVSDGGKTLNVPECYPVKLVGSIWEDTLIKQDNGNVNTLLNYLYRGEDIPWDKIGEGMWGDYGTRLGKAGKIWDFLQGMSTIRYGDIDSISLWAQEVNNALSKFGLRNEPQIKRWILYASSSINTGSRLPKLREKARKLQLLGTLGPRGRGYLRWGNMLFPWDQRGLQSRIIIPRRFSDLVE